MFFNRRIFKAIVHTKPVKLPLTYWVLVFLRFLFTILPQQGYIHPDEFFQNVEVIAGDIHNIDVARTWEFHPKSAIRNILVPKMILGPPLHFINSINPYTKFYLNIDLKTPYYLLVIPRIFICLLSLVNDYNLYRLCVLYGQNFRNRLTIFASSYVVLVYCCRSFSNAFEMMFFSMLLNLVAKSMMRSDKIIYHEEFLKEKYENARTAVEKVQLFKLTRHLPKHSVSDVVAIAAIVIIGIFNRPTFVGFAFPPVFFWLHRGIGSKVIGFRHFHCRILVFILCCIPPTLILILTDSMYYGYLTMAEVNAFKVGWGNWVVTPLNFLRYNLDHRNLRQHGLHPWWLHLVVNVPLLFNVLGISAVASLSLHLYRFIRGQYIHLPRIQSISGLMLFSLVTPVAVLSLFPHQEARFIIPVLIPLVYLYGNRFHPNEGDKPEVRRMKNLFRFSWYTMNILLTLFFGFVHQGGIYPFANSLHREIKSSRMYGTHIHVLTTHSYSIPTFLLQLDSTARVYRDKKTGQKYKLAPSTFIHRFGSLPMAELFTKIDEELSNAEELLHKHKKKYRLYLASPCSLEEHIRKAASKYKYFELIEEYSHYPHFCTEAFPNFPTNRDQFCVENNLMLKNESQIVDLNMLQRISCFFKRFCLRIYKVKALTKIRT